jgi:hypothetical protein
VGKKQGPEIFEALTHDETWVLAQKLTSGATMAGYGVGGDHDTCMEIFDVIGDVQANWKKGK